MTTPIPTTHRYWDNDKGIWVDAQFDTAGARIDERFQLDPTPLPMPTTKPVAKDEPMKQKPLFCGLDCLPGQQDLFDA